MSSILVRYHEIALKKGNRPYFVELLKRNLVSAVKDLGFKEIRSLPGRLLMLFGEQADEEEIRRRIERVFGVANFSFVERTSLDLEALKSGILEALDGRRFSSFRIDAKRGDKEFPLTSPEINRKIGAAVKETTGGRAGVRTGGNNAF